MYEKVCKQDLLIGESLYLRLESIDRLHEPIVIANNPIV